MADELKNIALSLGGNSGDVPSTFRNAISTLEIAGLLDIKLSLFYRTSAVGCSPGTPDFVNAALTGKWNGTAEELHSICKDLEVKAGRPSEHKRFSSRTLDIDIVFFGDTTLNSVELVIPHPEASKRLFVLVPLAEIAGDWIFPGRNESVSDILESFHDNPDLEKIRSSITQGSSA